MLANLIAFVLDGCAHKRMSWPQTKDGKCTTCCLDCGKEFAYDWQRMKVLPEREIA